MIRLRTIANTSTLVCRSTGTHSQPRHPKANTVKQHTVHEQRTGYAEPVQVDKTASPRVATAIPPSTTTGPQASPRVRKAIIATRSPGEIRFTPSQTRATTTPILNLRLQHHRVSWHQLSAIRLQSLSTHQHASSAGCITERQRRANTAEASHHNEASREIQYILGWRAVTVLT